MKKLIIFGFLSTIIFTSCQNDIVGEGPIITKEITIDNFNGIGTYGDDRVIISYGETQKITVTGHANIIDKLQKNIYEDTWDIVLKDGNYKNAQLTVNIITPLLNSVELQGSGSVDISNFKSDENVAISIYGSGYIELNGNTGCKNLDITMEGSGAIYSTNNFEDLINLNIEIDGSAQFNGFPITSTNSKIDISGSGTCNVTAQTLLDVKITGSGIVNYKGNPTIKTNITGSGKINNFND